MLHLYGAGDKQDLDSPSWLDGSDEHTLDAIDDTISSLLSYLAPPRRTPGLSSIEAVHGEVMPLRYSRTANGFQAANDLRASSATCLPPPMFGTNYIETNKENSLHTQLPADILPRLNPLVAQHSQPNQQPVNYSAKGWCPELSRTVGNVLPNESSLITHPSSTTRSLSSPTSVDPLIGDIEAMLDEMRSSLVGALDNSSLELLSGPHSDGSGAPPLIETCDWKNSSNWYSRPFLEDKGIDGLPLPSASTFEAFALPAVSTNSDLTSGLQAIIPPISKPCAVEEVNCYGHAVDESESPPGALGNDFEPSSDHRDIVQGELPSRDRSTLQTLSLITDSSLDCMSRTSSSKNYDTDSKAPTSMNMDWTHFPLSSRTPLRPAIEFPTLTTFDFFVPHNVQSKPSSPLLSDSLLTTKHDDEYRDKGKRRAIEDDTVELGNPHSIKRYKKTPEDHHIASPQPTQHVNSLSSLTCGSTQEISSHLISSSSDNAVLPASEPQTKGTTPDYRAVNRSPVPSQTIEKVTPIFTEPPTSMLAEALPSEHISFEETVSCPILVTRANDVEEECGHRIRLKMKAMEMHFATHGLAMQTDGCGRIICDWCVAYPDGKVKTNCQRGNFVRHVRDTHHELRGKKCPDCGDYLSRQSAVLRHKRHGCRANVSRSLS